MNAAEKDRLRKTMRAERRRYVGNLSEGQRVAALDAAALRVQSLLRPDTKLGSYAPTAYEIDPRPCEDMLAQPASLPWFASREPAMVFRACGPLVKGPWGLLQPKESCALIEPDVLIVPVLAFTAQGHRLGQGGGHYDRYLERRREADTRPRTIGLAWDCQIAERLPVDEWDERLDFIATPSALYRAA